MNTNQRACANTPGLLSLVDDLENVPVTDLLAFRNTAGVLGTEAAVSLPMIRDMILIALDATESPAMIERNRIEARAALAEALDVLEGRA